MNFFLLLSKQGKVRLSKWYVTLAQKDRSRIIRDVCQAVLPRQVDLCNFVEIHEHKVVYRRYASLYFIAGECTDSIDSNHFFKAFLPLEFLPFFQKYCPSCRGEQGR